MCLSFTLGLAGCSRLSPREIGEAARITDGGNPKAGREAIRAYGCNACHTISGVPGARALVGPSLDGIADRSYLAGELPNTPANMMRWIEHPREVEPHTLMPEMNVTEEDSRNIAAYLYLLHSRDSYFEF
jgi:cytochrome c2